MLNLVERTLLGTLSTRAKAGDEFAQSAIAFLKKQDLIPPQFNNFYFGGALTRTALMDKLVTGLLEENKYKRIASLGCGFCNRYQRMAKWFGFKYWVDVDSEYVISLRKKFDPPTAVHKYLIANLTVDNLDYAAYDLIIAEGVLMYLPLESAQRIVKSAKHIIFDVLGSGRQLKLGDDQKWMFNEGNWIKATGRRFKTEKFGAENRDDRIIETLNDIHNPES